MRHLLAHDEACLFWDPGLGKTLSALLAFVLLQRQGRVKNMLVAAPLRIVQSVWRQEAQKWEPSEHFNIVTLHGSVKNELLEVASLADITLINYEGLAWLERKLHKQKWPWDIICFDELSKLKDSSTQRHKLLCRQRHNPKRLWGLTGTPAPNSMHELFGQLRIIDGGRALGHRKWDFEQRYFYQANSWDRELKLREGAGEAIAKRIAPICHQLSAADHLEMPERIDVWHKIELDADSMDLYRQLENDMYLDMLEGGREVTAANAGVLWGKLQQLAQGFVYSTDVTTGERTVERFNHLKIDVLEDIIEESSGESVLVFYKFNEDLAVLQKAFPKAKTLLNKGADALIAAWNRKEVPVMFANPATAGHGLNLQSGGHIMVYYTLESSNEKYIQCNGRLHRQGQANPVIIHHLSATCTVDDDIRTILYSRTTMQNLLFKRLSALQAAQAFS